MDFSDEMVDEIFKIFQVESEEIISKINNNLLSLEKNPHDKDIILMLFRDAHSLKGASRMIGFNDVQTIAHKIEDVLGLAKDNKILLDSNIVNVLYKAIDFLSELIQKSLHKKQQVYSEEISKQISVLENIVNSTDDDIQNFEPQDFNKDIFIENIEKINNLIVESLVVLMQIEINPTNSPIRELLSVTENLYNIFAKVGSFDMKKGFEDINVKLKFTMKGSNSLTIAETKEIHQIIDETINKLVSICELYNISIMDYYSLVFEKMNQSITILPNKPEISKEFDTNTIIEDNNFIDYKETVEEEEENLIKNEIESPFSEPSQSILDSNLIKQNFNDLLQNTCSVTEIKNLINSYGVNCNNNNINNILKKIIQILDFSITNETRLNEEIISVINQSIEYCDNLVKDKSNAEDNELILQRLEIVQQLFEFDKEESNTEITVNPNINKIKTLTELSDIFNTVEIKTLRVESSKLDELINQINELSLEKIKTKKHLLELEKINKEIEDWQKNITKTSNYLKYYDKKQLQTNLKDSSHSLFTKQILNLFIDNNKQIQTISSEVLNLQRMLQEDDLKTNLVINNLETMVKNIRVLPFATIFHLFGRMIRDIAQEKNKKINFEIIGSETSADKKIIEEIKAPLIHIIRNAIDHGIETPDERIQLGKHPEGKIVLSARSANNKVVIEIIDDGRGINLAKIKEKALSKGFLTQEELNSMTNDQITNLIFAPGFSTGDEITNISGRGIGLDVVHTKISQLNGKVKVISDLNKGCCVQIELPTTMSLLKVFLVKIADQTFAIPMENINTVLRKTNDEIIFKNNKKSIIFNNEIVNLYSLAEILNIPSKCQNTKNKRTILILENDNKIIALCVDELLGEQEVLHKKLSAPFYKLKNISGITTLISGEICLILNVFDIVNFSTQPMPNINLIPEQELLKNNQFTILLVDDSTTTISLEKNILTNVGYNIDTAKNPIEALEKMKDKRFDLIISDIEMPEMNGLDFLKKLKENEMFSDIPIIMVSSIFDEEKRQYALKSGAIKCITKGEFNQEDFQETVDEILHKNK